MEVSFTQNKFQCGKAKQGCSHPVTILDILKVQPGDQNSLIILQNNRMQELSLAIRGHMNNFAKGTEKNKTDQN